jgi:O-antigen ligase
LTSLARRVVLLGLDILLPYFVISRLCRDRARIAEAMAAFVMAMLLLTPLALYEFFKGWMIFAVVGEDWNAAHMYFPLFRGPFLRAQTTAGHSIFLGYFMAMALGMWLYLQGSLPMRRGGRWVCALALVAGLIVSLSRGPWLGAIIMVVVFLIVGPNARGRAVRAAAVAFAMVGALAVSPWGTELVQYLPFVGSIDEHTVVYRQQLALASWSLIQQNPFFGSFAFLKDLEQFRTGEGIIDLVNTYAILGLTYGLVGVALFIGVFIAAVVKIVRLVRRLAPVDPDTAMMGSAMLGCIVGTLLVLATTSFLHAMPYFVWAFLGLADAYVRVAAAASAIDPLVSRVGDAYPQIVR